MFELAFVTPRAQQAEKSSPDPLAQAMELRNRFADLLARHSFRPGDLAREKKNLGITKDEKRIVWLVIRELTSDPYDDLLRADYVKTGNLAFTAYEPDLVVGEVVSGQGGTMYTRLMCSALLEPVTDAILASWPLPPPEKEGAE